MKGAVLKKSIYIYAAVIVLVAALSWFANIQGSKKDIPPKGAKPAPILQPSETPRPTIASPLPSPVEETNAPASSRYGQISVRVMTQNNAAISNALIEIFPDTEIYLPVAPQSLETRPTDANGQAEIGENLGGTFILRTSAATFADNIRRIELIPGSRQKRISIRLKPEVQISGSVKKESGEPIAGATIGPLNEEKDSEEREINFPRFAQTDSNGRFIFKGLAPGMFILNVVVPDFQPLARRDIEAPADNIDFTLKGGGVMVQGMVIGSRDEKPQSGAGILMSGKWLNLYTKSDANGTFRFRNIPDGDFSLEPIAGDRKAGKFYLLECDGSTPVENIILKINQGITLSGKVFYFYNNAPISGVLLGIKHQDGFSTATTNGSGQFFFEPIIPPQMLEITLMSPEYLIFDEMRILEKSFIINDYMPDADVGDISISVKKQWTITGRVENVAAEQMANYSVFVKSKEMDAVFAPLNQDSSFSCLFISDGICQAGLYSKSMNLASELVEFALELGKPDPYIILTPAKPQIITGHVLDHTGARLGGCEILAIGVASNLNTKSDANGDFHLETLEKSLKISATSKQYTQKLEKEIEIPFSEELVLQFMMGQILAGTVVTSDEKPVASAQINYEWVERQSGEHKTNETNSDINGRFRITDINNDMAERIRCQPPGGGENEEITLGVAYLDDLPLPNENLKIILPVAATLRLRIFDTDNNLFTGDATIFISQKSANSGVFNNYKTISLYVRDGVALVPGLVAGTYRVKVTASRDISGYSDVFEFNESGGEVVVRLKTPYILKGHVNDSVLQKPIADAIVHLSFAPRSSEFNITNTTKTDADGLFDVVCMPEDELYISVSKEGYSTFVQIIPFERGEPKIKTPLTIALVKASASISGVVINTEGKPVAGVSVHARQINVLEESQAQSHSAATTDGTGKYLIADVTDGDYLLTAEKESLSAAESVTIKEQQSMVIVLTMKKKIRVYGALKTEQATLLKQPLILVNKKTENIYITQFMKDGKFELSVPQGDYKIRIGETELSGEIDLNEDIETFELDLAF